MKRKQKMAVDMALRPYWEDDGFLTEQEIEVCDSFRHIAEWVGDDQLAARVAAFTDTWTAKPEADA